MKISVIMPSYLGDYEVDSNKSAKSRDFKLQRAVDSFLIQMHKDSELIIVSDGCDQTCELIESKYSNFLKEEKVKLYRIDKQPHFSGKVRNEGLNHVTGDLVCYLDSDDMFGPYHLDIMNRYYDSKMSWMFYDDFLYDGETKKLRAVTPQIRRIGTSSFCHLAALRVDWKDGYGHDWLTIAELMGYRHAKMNTPEYLVCHMSAINLDF
jgi:glycosyltransferase involved in cell wall biosynthesis